jgi:tRNA(Ile)-lysidine synthase
VSLNAPTATDPASVAITQGIGEREEPQRDRTMNVPAERLDARGAEVSLAGRFAEAMRGCAPFEASPALAVAVSGGADSTALAVLARDWVAQNGGHLQAAIVDHGLRSDSAQEAADTAKRLTALGIAAHILRLDDLPPGPAVAERARIARYAALSRFCQEHSILHLLVGHHAADQQETLAMRILRSSQAAGLAGMAAVRERHGLRILRPLLGIAPDELRQFLRQRGVGWVEDPSNRDRRALRTRLRAGLPPPDPNLTAILARAGRERARKEAETAATLARRLTLYPEGYAILSPGRIDIAALQAVIRTIAGAPYPALSAHLLDLAADPRPATIAGVRFLPAGRLGPGLLVVREEVAIAPPIQVESGILWDRRFRITGVSSAPQPRLRIGKLGDAARKLRKSSALPSAILRTLPALWLDEILSAVPHLGYGTGWSTQVHAVFSPPDPLCGPQFQPADSSELKISSA